MSVHVAAPSSKLLSRNRDPGRTVRNRRVDVFSVIKAEQTQSDFRV